MQSLTRWLLGACLLTGRGGDHGSTDCRKILKRWTRIRESYLRKIDVKVSESTVYLRMTEEKMRGREKIRGKEKMTGQG